jgi:ATP-dependent RNA helicase DHX37/DHR1
MSATLRIADFVENKTLFETAPPVIRIDARQHPVTTHFDRKTRVDYVTQTINKAVKIHTRLPAGGILIFLTGQQEILGVCKRLEKRFGKRAIETRKATRLKAAQYNPIAELFSTAFETSSSSAPTSQIQSNDQSE